MPSSTSKHGLVPVLRFPGFRDAGEWEEKTLDDIAVFFKGKGISKSDIDSKGETPCIRYGELYTIYGEVIRTVFSKTKLPSSELFLSQKDDVLIPSSGETKIDIAKASCVLLNDIALGGDLNVLRPNENGIFLSYLLNGVCKREIAKKAQGDAVVHLYASQLKLLDVMVPKEPEQQKIADCLSSIDELITAQAQKIDTLKTHKKGLMQQLFPAEGETLPKQRFPEFRDAGEWCSDSLGKIFETSSGGTPSRSIKEYWNGKIPWITTSLVDFNVIYKSDEFISEKGLENSSAKIFPKGTILIAMYGQGKTRGKAAILGIEAATNQACAAILPKKEIDPMFVFLNFGNRYDEMRELSNSGGQENLSQGLVKELPFSFPQDIAEQQKIVSCLSSVNELITAQTQKLATFKTHKKALMQQLFPAVDEATA